MTRNQRSDKHRGGLMQRGGKQPDDDKRRQHLRARIQEHDAATVERVAAWLKAARHDRARFLVQRGDMATLLRPGNFATYAAFALEAEATALPQARPAPPRKASVWDLLTPTEPTTEERQHGK